MAARQKHLLVGAGAAAVVAAVIVVAAGVAKARVEGATPQDRIACICRLADEKPWGAGDAIAEAALEDSDVTVRQAALVALGRFVESKYRSTVEQCTRDASAIIRAAAAGTLGFYGDDAAADRLGEMVSGDPDEGARIGAGVGLGRCGSSRSIVWLLEAAEDEKYPDVQFRAIYELYQKLGMRYIGAKPAKVSNWKRQAAFIAEYVKSYPQVQQAYGKMSRKLIRRPEYKYIPACERKGQGAASRPHSHSRPRPRGST